MNQKIKHFALIVCFLMMSLPKIVNAESSKKSVEKEMKRVTWLIGYGKNKKALSLINESILLGGTSICGFTSEVNEDVINRNIAFRYFADLGVVLRKQGHFTEAAKCVRRSSGYVNSAQKMHAVLIEAWRLARKLDLDGLNILSDPPTNSGDLCSNDSALLVAAWADSENGVASAFPELIKFSPQKKQQALKRYRRVLRKHYLKSAFSIYPTPASYRALKKMGVKIDKPLLGVKGYFLGHGVQTFKSRKRVIRSMHRKVSNPCTKNKKSNCNKWETTSLEKITTKNGRYDLVFTRLVNISDRCEPDEGTVAYLLFYPKNSKEIQRIRLGELHENQTCGSGGWGDFGEVGIVESSRQHDTLKIGISGGSLVSKNCADGEGARDDMVFGENGSNFICAPDAKQKLHCIEWGYSQTVFREQTFPELNIAKDGSVVADLRHVNATFWSPLIEKLTGNVVDIAGRLPMIREEFNDKFSKP